MRSSVTELGLRALAGDPPEALRRCCLEGVARETRAPVAALFLDEGRGLHLRAAVGLPGGALGAGVGGARDPVTSATRTHVVAPRFAEAGFEVAPLFAEHGLVGGCLVPLPGASGVLAALDVESRSFDAEALPTLDALATVLVLGTDPCRRVRACIRRTLHDDLAQSLTGIALVSSSLERRLRAADDPATSTVELLVEEVGGARATLRALLDTLTEE